MSKYCGEKDVGEILEAAQHWKIKALENEASVFTDGAIWTTSNLQAFDRAFTQSPDETDRPFFEKLHDQLSTQAPEIAKLAAEALWLLLLSPSNVTPDKKRENITAIWKWSGSSLPSDSHWLSNQALSGIGSAGPAYGNHRPRELTFLLNLLLNFRKLAKAKQSALLSDAWKFAHWLQTVPDAQARQFRHMLLYLLFPDEFERAFSSGDRKAIAECFSGVAKAQVNKLSAVELDELLLTTRKKLEFEFGTQDLDYYLKPLAGRWWRDLKSATENVTADHVRSALAEIDEKGVGPHEQSSTYDLVEGAKRYPPKLVLSLAVKYATGTPLSRSMFSGGEDTPGFKVLRDLGFSIEQKNGLAAQIEKFLAQAISAQDLRTSDYAREYRGLSVRVSFGQGAFSRVPWIAFLGAGQKVSEGIYPVLLYYREAKQLILAYGISETTPPVLRWAGMEGPQTVLEFQRTVLNREPERYGNSYVDVAYEVPDGLDVHDLISRLDAMIEKYRELIAVKAENPEDVPGPKVEEYTREQALDDAFFTEEFLDEVLHALERRKNVILQGPPGVGKTFIARKIADAFVGSASSDRVAIVQFHAAYSYEDFVQGYRPIGSGGFERKDGIFVRFCQRALADPGQRYVLIIDEINRANLSKVLGEALLLIENDKRHKKYAAGLAYSTAEDAPFYVPENLAILGLMNTADRSLALVDYALRRRFEFFDVAPALDSKKFEQHLDERGVPPELIARIKDRVGNLNEAIVADRDLGTGYRIGHSYFCGLSGDESVEEDYRRIIERQILPLLKEYWFEGAKVAEWS